MLARLLVDDQGPVLKAYRESRKFVHVIRGPIGSAKTKTSIRKLLELIVEQKPNKKGERRSRWAVVRNTYPDLTNTTIRDWREVIDPLRLGNMTMGHPPEHKLDFDLPDGTRVLAEVIFLALDKDEHVRKLRGLNLTGAWVNEAKELPKSIIDMLTGRVDRYPAPGTSSYVGIFGDTNAWDSDHWLETVAKAKRDHDPVYDDYEIFVQPAGVIKVDGVWKANPDRENARFLGPEYYERQIAGKREDWIKVNLANEIGYYVDGRAVHSEYSDTLHGSPLFLKPVAGRVCHVGLDFGLTPAAAFFQKQEDGQWIGFDEIVIEDGDATTLADEIKAKMAEWTTDVGEMSWVFRGDPSGDKRGDADSNTALKVLRGEGLHVMPASSNEATLRRAALDRPLTRNVRGKPGIVFSAKCRVLRKGLAGGFHYKRLAIAGQEGIYRDVPFKNMFSHVCEAAEYALMDAGENAIVDSRANKLGGNRGQNAVVPTAAWDPFKV